MRSWNGHWSHSHILKASHSRYRRSHGPHDGCRPRPALRGPRRQLAFSGGLRRHSSSGGRRVPWVTSRGSQRWYRSRSRTSSSVNNSRLPAPLLYSSLPSLSHFASTMIGTDAKTRFNRIIPIVKRRNALDPLGSWAGLFDERPVRMLAYVSRDNACGGNVQSRCFGRTLRGWLVGQLQAGICTRRRQWLSPVHVEKAPAQRVSVPATESERVRHESSKTPSGVSFAGAFRCPVH